MSTTTRRTRRATTLGTLRFAPYNGRHAATVYYRDAAEPLTTHELSLGWMLKYGPARSGMLSAGDAARKARAFLTSADAVRFAVRTVTIRTATGPVEFALVDGEAVVVG